MAELLSMETKRNNEKQKALDSALAQIERQFGKGSIMKLGADNPVQEIEATSTGSLGLDIALGIGGLPKGRIIEIYGPESSGKTTLTLHCVAEEQKKGGVCAFVDAEHALDPQYAKKTRCRFRRITNFSTRYRRTSSDFGVSAATESTTTMLTAPDLTNVSVISNACSPVSG